MRSASRPCSESPARWILALLQVALLCAAVCVPTGCTTMVDNILYGQELPSENVPFVHRGREVPAFHAKARLRRKAEPFIGDVIRGAVELPENGCATLIHEFCSKNLPIGTESWERARKNAIHELSNYPSANAILITGPLQGATGYPTVCEGGRMVALVEVPPAVLDLVQEYNAAAPSFCRHYEELQAARSAQLSRIPPRDEFETEAEYRTRVLQHREDQAGTKNGFTDQEDELFRKWRVICGPVRVEQETTVSYGTYVLDDRTLPVDACGSSFGIAIEPRQARSFKGSRASHRASVTEDYTVGTATGYPCKVSLTGLARHIVGLTIRDSETGILVEVGEWGSRIISLPEGG